MRKQAVLLVVSTALSAFAAQGTQVSYRSGSDTVRAMLYRPQGKGLLPAIVVIHEFWGLNEWVEQQASKLADQGYVTLAVDLYRGKATSNPDGAHELMRGLPQDRADRDLRNAVQFLTTQGYVNSRKIGAIGWCMGGGYALDLALQEPTLAADVINYGHLATDTNSLRKINAPILGIFSGQDRGIPVEDVKKFEKELKRLGKQVDIVIYPDADHAFQNPNNKSGYREKDAADAWKRIVAFFARTLKH